MKKIFLSPFFMIVAFLSLWGSFACIIYNNHFKEIPQIVGSGGLIENITNMGYIFLLTTLLLLAEDYKDKIYAFASYLFLGIIAFLRECGIQHYLSKTDTTPFKSRFFLNPNNPLGEKIVFGAMLLLVLALVIYIAIKYSKYLVLGFLKLKTIPWSIAVLCTVGVIAKYTDRFPSKYRKSHNGVGLEEPLASIFSLVEESTEMFLPWIAGVILIQYHELKKPKTKNTFIISDKYNDTMFS